MKLFILPRGLCKPLHRGSSETGGTSTLVVCTTCAPLQPTTWGRVSSHGDAASHKWLVLDKRMLLFMPRGFFHLGLEGWALLHRAARRSWTFPQGLETLSAPFYQSYFTPNHRSVFSLGGGRAGSLRQEKRATCCHHNPAHPEPGTSAPGQEADRAKAPDKLAAP